MSQNCNCNTNIPLSINQYTNNIDQMMCSINAILQSLSSNCGGFNIDYGSLLSTAKDLPLLPGQASNADKLFDCLTNISLEDRLKSKEYFLLATKILNYFTQNKTLFVHISCDNENNIQEFSLDMPKVEKPEDCLVAIKFTMPSIKYGNKDHKKLIYMLCNSESPGLIAQFWNYLIPDDFFTTDWMETTSDDAPIYTVPEDYKPTQQSKKINPVTGCPEAGLSHIAIISGVECVIENGKEYVIYKIKDSYRDVNNENKVREYKIKININQNIPFEPGFTFNNFNIQRVVVSDSECSKIEKAKKKCCTSTTTPAPTSTSSPELLSKAAGNNSNAISYIYDKNQKNWIKIE